MRAGGRQRDALSRSPGLCGLPCPGAPGCAGCPAEPRAPRPPWRGWGGPGARGALVRGPRPPQGGAVSPWSGPGPALRSARSAGMNNSPAPGSGKASNRCRSRAGKGTCAMLRAGGRCFSLPGGSGARRHRSEGLRRLKSAVSPGVSSPSPCPPHSSPSPPGEVCKERDGERQAADARVEPRLGWGTGS